MTNTNQSKYLEKPIDITLKELIDPYIKKCKDWERRVNNRSFSNSLYGGNRTPRELTSIYRRRKLFGWSGYVYKITQLKDLNGDEISDGIIIVGMSTLRFPQRWFWYRRDAYKGKRTPIHQLISEFEEFYFDVKHVSRLESNAIAYFGRKKLFEFELIEICWTDGKLRTTEDYWVKYFLKIYPNRVVNQVPGGGGGPLFDIPRSLLIIYIAKGFSGPEIRDALNKKFGWNISKDLIYKKANAYWDSIGRARRIFQKPILRQLLTWGYSATYLGDNLYPRHRVTMKNWCVKFWGLNYKEARLKFLQKFVHSMILKGYNSYEMDEKLLGVPWSTIRHEYIPIWWNTNLTGARVKLLKPVLAQCLANKLTLKEIRQKLEFDSLERLLKYICILFPIWCREKKGRKRLINSLREFIIEEELSGNEVLSLTHEEIKEGLSNIPFKKFLKVYDNNPNLTLAEFRKKFPNKAKSNYYYWKNKAKNR